MTAEEWLKLVDLSPVRKKYVRAPGMAKLRLEVFKRDKHRCAMCQAFRWSKNLHAHHIDNDPAHNCLRNLITLCPPCHLGGHGRGDLPNKKLARLARQRSR